MTIFRVDNPHTKSFAFWEWVIDALKREHPETIFLAEAFTRPKVMHRLAKLGYSQSYTYFTWRNTKHELVEYFTELSQHASREYFRPNVWPNTPDILHAELHGRRPAGVHDAARPRRDAGRQLRDLRARLRAARRHAARAAQRGISRLGEVPAAPLESRGRRQPGPFVATVNRIRRDNPALQGDWSLRFCAVDNDQLIAYAKTSGDNTVVCVVNLDPDHTQSGWVELDLAALGIAEGAGYEMHDLLTEQRFFWQSARNFVILDPNKVPAHVMRLVPRGRTEPELA